MGLIALIFAALMILGAPVAFAIGISGFVFLSHFGHHADLHWRAKDCHRIAELSASGCALLRAGGAPDE